MSDKQLQRNQRSSYQIRKYLISAFVFVSFAAYVLHDNSKGPNTEAAVLPVQAPKQTDAVTPLVTVYQPTPTVLPTDTAQAASTLANAIGPQSSTPTDVPTQAPPTAIASSGYKDGQYTGQTTDAFYGAVQVQVAIQGGKIANVQFLQFPNDRRTSQRINSQAMPMLQTEAMQSQSAQVDIISGATLTSQAFIQSLQSALDNAKG
jgi:uncharacterized protein with FMN-binding domain